MAISIDTTNKTFLNASGLAYYNELVQEEIKKAKKAGDDAQSTADTAKSTADAAKAVTDTIESGAQVNRIETVQVNGTALTISDKIVNIDISGKADKATTLSGYGITDAYTTTGTDSAIATAVAAAKKEILLGDDTGTINEAYDTIKEIADWISSNTEANNAYTLITRIAKLEGNDSVTSGITAEKVSNYDTHIADKTIHVTSGEKEAWSGKQAALTDTQLAAVNSGITSSLVDGYTSHKNDTTIHVTETQKNTWTAAATTVGEIKAVTKTQIDALFATTNQPE